MMDTTTVQGKKNSPPPGIWIHSVASPSAVPTSLTTTSALTNGDNSTIEAPARDFQPRRPAPPPPPSIANPSANEDLASGVLSVKECVPKRSAPSPPQPTTTTNNHKLADWPPATSAPSHSASPSTPFIESGHTAALATTFSKPSTSEELRPSPPPRSQQQSSQVSLRPPLQASSQSNSTSASTPLVEQGHTTALATTSSRPSTSVRPSPPPRQQQQQQQISLLPPLQAVMQAASPAKAPHATSINGPVPPPAPPSVAAAKSVFLNAVPDSDDAVAAVADVTPPVVTAQVYDPFAAFDDNNKAMAPLHPGPRRSVSHTPPTSPPTVSHPPVLGKSLSQNDVVKKAPPPLPPKRSTSGESLVVKVVQWDFDGSGTPGGLSVKQGDKVTVVSEDNLWCTVSRENKRGLVPKSYLADPQMRKRALERMPRRPATFDYGKESGFARDLIAVRSVNGAFGPITTPVVRFWGNSAKREHIGDRVQVFIDGRAKSELRMGEAGTAVFAQTGLYAWDLHSLAPHALKDDSITCLHVRFEHMCSEDAVPARFAECTLFVWHHDDDIIVSDVDGTITLSDVGGHLNTTLLQKAGYSPNTYAHLGVCALYSFIRETFHCRFLYVTARPLNLCVETRNYLRGLKQDGKVLPLGPCITDATSYYGSLRREVVDKSSHLFKSEFLVYDLRRCFVESGRNMMEKPVFMAGFGNKDTDALAYRNAGIHPVLIFSIDKRSIVTTGAGYASELASYDDPNLKSWISEMITLFQSGKLPPT